MKARWPFATIRRMYTFTARHWLHCSEDVGAQRDHDHVYVVTVILKHELNPHTDWMVYDFPRIDKVVVPVIKLLHQQCLNHILPDDVPPTSEAVAFWILCQLPAWIDELELSENPHSQVHIRRRDILKPWREKLMRGAQTMNGNSDL